MSFYKIAKLAYRRLKHRKNRKVELEVEKYVKECLEKYGEVLGVDSQHKSQSNKTLLIYSNHNLSYSMHIESILAKKIQLKYGWNVVFLCTLDTINLAKRICGGIYGLTNFLLIEDFMPLVVSAEARRITKPIDTASLEQIKSLMYKNTPIGIHALASYSTTIPTAKIELTLSARNVLKKLIQQSTRYCDAVQKVLDQVNPNLMISVEKGTVGLCEIFYQSLNRKIDYVQYVGCHEPNTIVFKRYNKENIRAHSFSISEESWLSYKYEEYMKKEVLESFKNGYERGDWFKYKNLSKDKKIMSRDELTALLNLDPTKKNAIIFSHILSDANFFYGKDLFEGGFREWFVKTVEVASRNEAVNWLIKLHPANIFRRKNQGYTGEYGEILALKEYLGGVPDNITVIPADININPYSFFMMTDYGVTVRGTVGAELPCFGVPVLTAGTGRYSHKGFTIDSDTSAEYLHKIETIDSLQQLSDKQIQLAIKHAYLFFKQRPTQYSSFIKDLYQFGHGHPIARDIELTDVDIWHNQDLDNLTAYLVMSQDEDFLMNKKYGLENG